MWNQLPAEVPATFFSKTYIFRQMDRKLIISENKWEDFKGGDETSKMQELQMWSELKWSFLQWSEVKWRKWSEVDWNDDLRWIVCIIIDL